CIRITHNIDAATNELILRDVPDEAILVEKINNKIPGLGLQLDASEVFRSKPALQEHVQDSYEHLLLDVVDDENHLFMISNELAAPQCILSYFFRTISLTN
ncbi:unnamed protein product, partial [Linum tenue]